MSLAGLIDKSKMDIDGQGIGLPSTDIFDVFSTGLESITRNQLTTSETFQMDSERYGRDKRYKELTGRDLYADAFDQAPEPQKLFEKYTVGQGFVPNEEQSAAVDAYLLKIRQQDPEKFKDLANSSQIKEIVKEKAKAAAEIHAKAVAGASDSAALFGQVGAGLVSGFADPLNLMTIPLGAGMASSIFRTALIEAGINAGAEVVAYPFVKKWQQDLGQEYGQDDLIMGMGISALFGGIVGAGGKFGAMKLEEMSNSAKLATMRQVINDLEAKDAFDRTMKTSQPANEVMEALRHEERRNHIQEADPARYNPDIGPEVHSWALEQVDAAVNEGRMVRVPLPDEDFKKIDVKMLPKADQAAAKLVLQRGLKNNLVDFDDAELQKVRGRQKILLEELENPDSHLDPAGRRVIENDLEILNRHVGPHPDTLPPGQVIDFRPRQNSVLLEPRAEPIPLDQRQEIMEMYDSPEMRKAEIAEFENRFQDPEERIFMEVGEDGQTLDLSADELRQMFKDDDSYFSAISSCGLPKGEGV